MNKPWEWGNTRGNKLEKKSESKMVRISGQFHMEIKGKETHIAPPPPTSSVREESGAGLPGCTSSEVLSQMDSASNIKEAYQVQFTQGSIKLMLHSHINCF